MQKTLRQTPFDFNANTKAVNDPQLTYDELLSEFSKLRPAELAPFVRSYIQERTPAAFAHIPLLWEAIRDWLSSRLSVSPREIGMSGSGQSGYTFVGNKRGKSFQPNGSDLDIFMVNEALFNAIEKEARIFSARAHSSNTFLAQAATVDRTLRKNYIDLNQIPAKEHYPIVSKGRNDASILIDRLKLHGFHLEPSHFRVYKSWGDLTNWVRISYQTLQATQQSR